VRGHGASVKVVESTTFSASTSHFAYPRSRGSAFSSPATDGQNPRNPSALRRPSTATTADGGNPVLEVRDLVVDFATPSGTLRAVDHVSFSLGESETLAVLGESGSGKSVTSLAVMGLLPRPAARIAGGEILFRGRDLAQASPAQLQQVRGARISMIFQDPLSALNPVLTVGYQIGEVLWRHGRLPRRQAKRAAVELMERVRIPDAAKRVNDYPHQFSGGMRQRILIAMALALGPEVLIADEPTTALDVTVQKQILDLLKELQAREGMGLVLISHDLGVVADYANRVAVMYAGRVVETGTIRGVYERPAHPYTLGLMRAVPMLSGGVSRLVPIEGSPPDLLRRPPGCPFHPRCPYARARCAEEEPALREVGNGRLGACHYAEEVLGDGA
jgi:oligopeptide transport system ATP-binding protein